MVSLWRLVGGFGNPPMGQPFGTNLGILVLPRDARPSLPWNVLLASPAALEACER